MATGIGLLGISAAQTAAGISLKDTPDSVMMARACGWAFVNPARKLGCNMTITAASRLSPCS